MRDPDLVYRAERAAIALERAWSDWRVMHGAGTGPLPQITSYVGYSLTEPWGEPRVVLGVPADEAERLAALLEGQDSFGPVHAEVASRPDWRLGTSGAPAEVGGRSYDGPIEVPAQARGPEADEYPASWQELPRNQGGAASDSASRDAVAGGSPARDSAARDSAARERAARERAAWDGSARERTGERRGDGGLPDYRPVPPDDGVRLPDGAPRGTEGPRSFPPEPLLPAPENNRAEPAGPTEVPGQVPAQGGPGYRGPRYLGSPPRYQPETDDDAVTGTDAADPGRAGWDAGIEHYAGTGTADPGGHGDPADAEHAGIGAAGAGAGAAEGAATSVADFADDDTGWVDLGPAVTIGAADETGLDSEAGIDSHADLDTGAGLDTGADPDADSGPGADAGLASDAEGAADADLAFGEGQTAVAAVGDAMVAAAEEAGRRAGKGSGQPSRASARKADRRSRSGSGQGSQPAKARTARADKPAPGTDPEAGQGDPAAAGAAEQHVLAADDAAQDAAAGGADGDRSGAAVPGKPGRPRSRPVARLSRSRRSTPGAHEGSGWPPTGRAAKNSKV